MAHSGPRRPVAPRGRVRVLLLGMVGLGLAWMVARAGPALVVRVPVENPEAIISLGSHEWERLPTTARLAAADPEVVVLLTEPPEVTEFNCHDCANRIRRLELLGVPNERIRSVQLTVSGTYGEAIAALDYTRRNGLRRLTIVTSPYHARRSLGVFRKVFDGTDAEIGMEPAIADSVARPERWWLAGYDRAYVAYEWAAIAYYAWKYGVVTSSG